jgi:hypothetical protein
LPHASKQNKKYKRKMTRSERQKEEEKLFNETLLCAEIRAFCDSERWHGAAWQSKIE